ncbi:MBL fold metallo-hydrolase [Acetohalobium arabaticum]|uniref:Beta-lactamase n=1 Tax=Acetohalobium arabaticum (strain ATCC 49924 / DSM 5501 / Z-7288) TaxID=574087 RepID=D9QVK1_ACEAZ|nr:MBL fold metallo-hydrolase [Acetohalobium arabaticum]ADL12260.1 beta-lactamase [Acetohalobium arabaticum DSM 5501]
MIVKKIPVGSLGANCYMLGDEESGKAIVIDPGAEGAKILDLVNELSLELKYIVNTHGHYDHIGANQFLLQKSQSKLLIHQDDSEFLVDPKKNLSSLSISGKIEGPKADRLLTEGDEISCGKWELEVIHTPGHTPGGITLLGNGKLFVGDTIFARGVGRTDFPYGSKEVLMESIQEKLLPLADELEVFPGHGPKGKLGEIKASNPFL